MTAQGTSLCALTHVNQPVFASAYEAAQTRKPLAPIVNDMSTTQKFWGWKMTASASLSLVVCAFAAMALAVEPEADDMLQSSGGEGSRKALILYHPASSPQ